MSSKRPAASTRPPRSQATRDRLCGAARDLFFERGFEGTTMEQIADAAGTRRSTLYNHFRDKDEILTALVADYLGAVRAMIAGLPAPAPTYAEIEDWVRRFAELARREKAPTVLLIRIGAGRHVPAAVRAFGEAMFEALAERSEAFARAGSTSLEQARAQAVVRQLGSALVHFADDPEEGGAHLVVAAEWLDRHMNGPDARRGRP